MNTEQMELIVKWKAVAAWKALDDLPLDKAMKLIVAWATEKDAHRLGYLESSVCLELAALLEEQIDARAS